MRPGWKGRAALWLGLVEAARANRQEYPTLPTAWVPHAVGNTVALWLPEALAALDRGAGLEERVSSSATGTGLRRTLREICVDNPTWALYVAPLTLGYILSHPRFSIYKGEWGEMRVLGFGLDAIPHSAMAFTLTLLIQHGIASLARNLPQRSPVYGLAHAFARNPAATSATLLGLLSAGWEAGEWWARQEELRRTDGDASAVNMEWTIEDTMTDQLANGFGWLAAALLEAQGQGVFHTALTPSAPSD